MEKNKVFSISFKGGTCCVDYEVTPENASPERNRVRKGDKLHENFTRLLLETRAMAAEMLELGLTNSDGQSLDVHLEQITFLQHDVYGEGIRIKVQLCGLTNSFDDIFITTPAYFALGKYSRKMPSNDEEEDEEVERVQQLSSYQVQLVKQLKEEAFKFAYYGKRLQPTAMEATEAAENGGFKDELPKKKVNK